MVYEIKNPEVEARLKELGRYLKDQMPAGMGFTLLMSDFGPAGATFYISSIERPGALASMEEFLIREGHLPPKGSIPSIMASDLGIVPPPTKTPGELPPAMPPIPGLPPMVQEIHDAGIVLVRQCVKTNATNGRFTVHGLMLDGVSVGQWEVTVKKIV